LLEQVWVLSDVSPTTLAMVVPQLPEPTMATRCFLECTPRALLLLAMLREGV
jgi:hypothetical protein